MKVYGNAQDALGDTMNDGEIQVFGSVGDAPGYAMRGGELLKDSFYVLKPNAKNPYKRFYVAN